MADALGFAANVIAVVDLSIKVGVLCSVYCANLKTAPRDVRYILNEADRLTATLKDVERLLAGPNGAKIEASQNVRCSVVDCQLLLGELAAKLEQGTRYERIMWPLKKEEVADILKKLERYRAAISLDLCVNQTAVLLDVHQEIVLAKLRTAEGATFDPHADAYNARCHPGTRVDILQQILTWGAACDGECIFWLNGMAGTGKSTISRTVAQSFAGEGMLGASFFFKRGEGDRGRVAFFFTTIAAQLVHQLPSLAPHVRNAIEAEPTINEKSAKDQFDKLIADPIEKLPTHSQPSAMLVVVDALDECDSLEHARLIIHLLSQAKQFTSIRLKFFVTSRPELPIRLGFKDISGKYEDLVLHQIPKPVIEHDITEFLQDELAKIRQDYNKSVTPSRQLPPHWPGTDHIQKLVDMAVPLFIFAATVCRFIQDRRLGSPEKQLTKTLEHQTSRKSNLDATYLPVLDQLLVVGSIVILTKPLSTSSLARLLAVSSNAIEDQLDLLHAVLSIPSDPSLPVRLLHLSFRDFLVDPEKGREQERYPFWVDERETHERLATRCLQLLSTGDTLKRDVCGLRLPGTRRSEIDQQTIGGSLPPEIQYACQYWVYHWKESKPEGVSNISTFLRDTRRVILNHCSIIDASPLQIYCSAIVFAPKQSLVRKTFLDQFPVWLSPPLRVDSDWDTCLQTLEGHGRFISSVTFSHDSTLLASVSHDRTIKFWDVATGTCIATFRGHDSIVTSISFSHNSTLFASASYDRTIKLWNTATGACTETFKGHNSSVNSIVLSHDSTLLASASGDNTVKLWDVATGVCTATLEEHSGIVNSVAFSRDSTLLASASYDRTIKLWAVATRVCIETLKGHNSTVSSVAFSNDSTFLASASYDRTIKLWDVATGTCTATLVGHNNSVNSVALSHDSTLLASASYDYTVKLWNVAIGTCTVTLEEHDNNVNSVAFSHDSTLLASASYDHTIKLWNVASDSFLYPNAGTSTISSLSSTPPISSTSAISMAVRTEAQPPPTPAPGPFSQRADCWGFGLSEDGAWVTWESQRLIWLPPSFHPVVAWQFPENHRQRAAYYPNDDISYVASSWYEGCVVSVFNIDPIRIIVVPFRRISEMCKRYSTI
ncbi:hypothetical protein QBC46DRAFT_336128 [Diplogelasinospora grovesii]|uniref:NACHT domain-containing protein n=1 Tax=Diplogelasinospora grovesii TaxID=303347 RepID=A0AAN6S9Z7_9PEZI|nr:hypothetical protein QBC46DRAFT_336128 [Diplogelasinospora grovesii]